MIPSSGSTRHNSIVFGTYGKNLALQTEWILTEFNGIYKGRLVQSSDIMSPFGVRVDQVMMIDEQLCYIYQAPYNRHGVHLMALEVNSNDSIKWVLPQESVEWAKKHGHDRSEGMKSNYLPIF